MTQNLDRIRIPLNGTERDERKGDVPYWGANRIVDYVDEALIDERVVLIGEDGAPFFERDKDVAFVSEGPIWPNNHIHILRPDRRMIEDRYLVYFLNQVDYSKYINGSTRDKLTQFQLGSIAIDFPSLDDQSDIADYLDRETGQIDGLVEKKTRFIALLKEKRAAVIDHAVTKGMDPSAEMKSSRVEWIGDIPAHWDAPRIATLFREAFRKPDPDLPVLSVSIHNGVSDGELSDEERDRKVALSEDRTKYQGVEPGDLVYNMMRAWQGAFGAVAVSGLVSPAYVVARPIAEFRTKFLEHLLHTKSAAEEIRRYSRGIADFRMRLYWEYFRDIRVCLPPLPEQDEILSHIDRETARIEGLIEKTERSIALLKEKRAALITAAVTGKIDVRAAA
ncbi:restriction endonuclease subunit S [uncultured Shimia sp.]|uniref:restriction endonuclease subunit S n=1 Tax=uncultured Shimia sp. TaxID=573152 RepID=UPI0026047F3C|nr:restriction endonuclease subunit S [uncultured Shimia sp.]